MNGWLKAGRKRDHLWRETFFWAFVLWRCWIYLATSILKHNTGSSQFTTSRFGITTAMEWMLYNPQSFLQPLKMIMLLLPCSCNCMSGAWQPVVFITDCVVLWSYNHNSWLFLPVFGKHHLILYWALQTICIFIPQKILWALEYKVEYLYTKPDWSWSYP